MTRPRDAARMYLMANFPDHNAESIERLTGILELFAVSGLNQGIGRCQTVYRDVHSGSCRRLSEGERCRCFLCQTDELKVT